MTSNLRDILTAVREGRLEPADAAQLLATPEPLAAASQQAPESPTAPRSDGPEAAEPDRVDVLGGDAWAEAVDSPMTPAADQSAAAEPTPEAGAGEGATAATADAASDLPAADLPTATVPPAEQAGHEPEPVTRTPKAALDRTSPDAPATTSLRLRAMTRRVRVVADAAVSTVSVEGPHELRREGTTLILESDRDLPFGDPFSFLPAMRGGFRLQPGRGLPLSLGSDLVVRVNPSIALDIDVTAGSLSVRGGGRVRARVTAGSARIEDVTGPLDLHVVGGTAKVDMAVRGGDNRIRCESGSITLRLRRDSDVRLRPDAQLGRITIDGVEGGREIVVGAGTGRLDVEIVMGNLQVDVEDGRA